jgi:hypothetical protein
MAELYWKNSLANKCADKYLAREVVRERGCPEILNDLYGAWENAEEIDFEKLPESFVLKVNHGCGYNIFVKDKSKLNINKTRKQLNNMLRQKYYIYNYEWVYKDIKPMIICEKLFDISKGYPVDYKFFCFDGEPKFMFIATDRYIDTKFDFFDLNFNRIPVKQHYEIRQRQSKNPKDLKK